MEKIFAAVIPARYASTRFPGKPLAMIDGKMMVERVYEQASKAVKLVYVATDDNRIYDAVKGFGGKAVLTSSAHKSGTDRCAEAVTTIQKEVGAKLDVVINIQGDEPFILPEQVEQLKGCFADDSVELATLIRKVGAGEPVTNINQVKVVVSKKMDALYFSRLPIPYMRDVDPVAWTKKHVYYKHIGMYGYTSKALFEVTHLPVSSLEKAESLEQNRWLENGYRIRCAITDHESVGIDTPEDLERAINRLKR